MSRHTARSVSLPLESNPIVLRITKELKKLKAWEETSTSKASTLSIGLSGISDLYKCVGQFLSLPLTQQALSMHQHGKFVAELVEGSSRLLEICSATRNVALQLKEASRSLCSFEALHELSISRYFTSRKEIKKSAKELLSSLKRMERDTFGSSKLLGDVGSGHRLSVVINVLRCVSIICVSILESLISFLGMPVSKPKSSMKIPLISKMMNRKGKSVCEESSWNELESVDLALRGLCCNVVADEEGVQALKRRSEALEVGIDGILNGLDSLFKQLTETRVSLVETLSF